MNHRLKPLLLFIAVLAFPSVARATPICVAGTLDSVRGTSCTVGAVQFDFSSPWFQHIVANTDTHTQTQTDFSAALLTFTPYSAGNDVGFVIGGLPQASGDTSYVQDYFYAGIPFLVSGPITYANAFLVNASVTSYATIPYDSNAGSGVLAELHLQFPSPTPGIHIYSRLFEGFSYTDDGSAGIAPWPTGMSSDWGMVTLATDVYGGGTASADGFGYAFTVAPVPEPSTWLLLGTGLVGAVRAVRKRRG